MNDLETPPTYGGRDRRPEDLDGLLRRFFRSEMPDPWPAVPPVSAPRPQQPRRWVRLSNRFALAAAVGLFLIGYLALAARFPASSPSGGSSIPPVIGKKDGVRPGLPPTMPRRANPGKLQGNSGMEMLRPEIVPIGNGGEVEIRGARTQGPRRTIYLHVERIR